MSHTRQEIVRRNGLTLAHRTVDAFAANPADPYGGANQEIPIKPQPESSALPFSHRARTDELVHRSMRSLGFLLFRGVSGRVRLARSDVDQLFGTDAGCAGD